MWHGACNTEVWTGVYVVPVASNGDREAENLCIQSNVRSMQVYFNFTPLPPVPLMRVDIRFSLSKSLLKTYYLYLN